MKRSRVVAGLVVVASVVLVSGLRLFTGPNAPLIDLRDDPDVVLSDEIRQACEPSLLHRLVFGTPNQVKLRLPLSESVLTIECV